MVRRVGIVSFATLISRILGYGRDALVAHAFGGGALTDAFYAAFRLPNLFRRILGEGPLTSAFVPVFTEHLCRAGRQQANLFFQTLFTSLFTLLAVLVTLGMLGAPWLTQLIAWGFKAQDPEKFELTVRLTRQMFPFLLFVCLAAVTAGALNALGYFFVPALAPAMLSVAEISFVLLFMGFFDEPLVGLAISAVAGGALHFLVMVPLMRRENIQPRWLWNPSHPDVKRVAAAILPAVWGMSLDQVNAYMDTVCASFLVTGSVTALYNSNRLMQFPLALFGIAASTASLPSLSMLAAKEDWLELKRTLNFTLRMVFFTIVPAALGLIVLGEPVIQLLFQHGAFTPDATRLTNAALIGFCLGLPAFSGVKVVVSAFYALKDVKTPVKVATACLFVNMAGNLTLMWKWGVGGLAISTTLASCVNAGALLWLLRKRLGLLGGRRLAISFAQSLGASILMSLAAWLLVRNTEGSLVWRVPSAVGAGVAVYWAAAAAMGMEELKHLVSVINKKAKP